MTLNIQIYSSFLSSKEAQNYVINGTAGFIQFFQTFVDPVVSDTEPEVRHQEITLVVLKQKTDYCNTGVFI